MVKATLKDPSKVKKKKICIKNQFLFLYPEIAKIANTDKKS